MNKTLLLIIIDFLFLNLIALTRWENVEPAHAQQMPVPQSGPAAATKDQDLVATMRQSLADEQAERQALENKLSQAGTDLSSRQQGLTQLQAERSKLAATLAESQRNAQVLTQQAQAAKEESTLTRDQLAQLQRELEEKRAEADRQRQQIAALNDAEAKSREQIAGLNTKLAVGETERASLVAQTGQLQQQVAAERADRIKVQAQTEQLAQGVGTLAQNSGALTKEIRENRPINANVLFNDFLANRVETDFVASRKGMFGNVNREKRTPTVLVSDGKQVYALLHIDDTPFSDWQDNYDWEKITATFEHSASDHVGAKELDFLAIDPRVVVVPIAADEVQTVGGKVYPLAIDPFKFPDAVLISGDRGYGVLSFKLDPSHPGFVRVDNRFFKRLFGDSNFAPERGDLVFSHTGELLGIMVNKNYCALLRDFTPMATLKTGDHVGAEHSAQVLNQIASRVRTMTPDMQ